MNRKFQIRATHTKDKEVIWLCRFFGEPFEVVPVEDSKIRKLKWRTCELYFDKYIDVHYNSATPRGVPTGIILGYEITNNR